MGIYEIEDMFKWSNFLRETNWFVYAILVLYIVFYVIFKNAEPVRGCKTLMMLLLFINIGLYFSSLDRIYYGGNFCFGLGVMYSLFFDLIIQKIRKHRKLYIVVMLFMFVIGTFLYLRYGRGSFWGDWIGRNATTIAIVVLLVLFLQKYSWENKILKFLGCISYEIYLVHLGMLSVLSGLQIKLMNNSIRYYTLLLLISISVAYMLHVFCNCNCNAMKKIFGVSLGVD